MELYLKTKAHVVTTRSMLRVKDLATVCCHNLVLATKVGQQEVVRLSPKEKTKVVSALLVVEKILAMNSELSVQVLGPEDMIVSRHVKEEEKRGWYWTKYAFVAVVIFFGSAFSIMAYNTDIGIAQLFAHVYQLTMGRSMKGPGILHVSYAVGLATGLMVFFHHTGKGKETKEPSPLEVQMRLYERDVDDTTVIDLSRKGEEDDVDG